MTRPSNLKLRPEIEAALSGERDLHQLTGFTVARTCVAAGMKLHRVPPERWSAGADDEGYTQAVIDCTCGQKPRVYAATVPEQCGGCERWFFYDTHDVWVFNSPVALSHD